MMTLIYHYFSELHHPLFFFVDLPRVCITIEDLILFDIELYPWNRFLWHFASVSIAFSIHPHKSKSLYFF